MMWWSGDSSPSWWGVLQLQVVFALCSFLPQIGSLSLKPPAEEILNSHMCPDPVVSRGVRLPQHLDASKIMTVSLQRAPRKDGTNAYLRSVRRFRPCTFSEDPGSHLLAALLGEDAVNTTLVRIRSINLNVSPWNFSTATECSKFIMFRSWAEYGNGYPMTCGRDSFDQYLGPYGHPLILYYHLKEQGISFPLFHPNYAPSGETKSPLELKYMLIYYSLKQNGAWTCRVQQYRLDPLQEGCPSSGDVRNCGEYPCSELEALYQKKMGVVREGDLHQQRFIIVKSKTQEKYRVRNFLRQKFVPIVFLLVLIFAYKSYMRAGLRLNDPLPLPMGADLRLRHRQSRLRQHHHHSHLQPYLGNGGEHFQDVYFEYGGEHIPGLHIPYEPPPEVPGESLEPTICSPQHHQSHVKYGRSGDPPPSYDSLFPPTYTEATATALKNPKV